MNLSDSGSSDTNNDDELDRFFNTRATTNRRPTDHTSPAKKVVKRKRKTDEDKLSTQQEKISKQEEKAKKREEKLKIQEEKAREKAEKKKATDLLKRLKPGECMKYISIVFDSELLNNKYSGELLTSVQTNDIQYSIKSQKVPNSISWIRKVENETENRENHLIIIWMAIELVNLIAANKLKHCFDKCIDENVTLLIYGIEEYFRSKKTLKNREMRSRVAENEPVSSKSKTKQDLENAPWLSRMDVETALAELQILHNFKCRFVENNQELSLFITQFTKSLAELPYKLDKNKKNENTDWYAAADSKECVRVDNDGNGLLRLWQQQICQFPNVGLDLAQTIVAQYNSPQSLIEAYDKCSDRKEAELLLQNIPVRRTQGPLTSVRRIGPELSKKLYIFFNNLDGNAPVGQES